MLSPEEIEPDAADVELGKRLVAEGWKSISTKYRRVARWVREAPPLLEIVDPVWRSHPAILAAAKACDYARNWGLRDAGNPFVQKEQSPDVETRELTIRQWRAFKRAGGQIA
jgi:hypothetical protein